MIVSHTRILPTSDATFEQGVLHPAEPILLDFWAGWCGPRKMIAPVLDDIADQFSDRVRVAKLNVDENPATPSRHQIRRISSLIFFKNGTPAAQQEGPRL
jgi:thioredoxin 1